MGSSGVTVPQAQELQPLKSEGLIPDGRPLKKFLSKDDALSLLEIMDASIMCKEEGDLKDLLTYFGKLFGAEFSCCLLAALDQDDRIASVDMLNANFPSGWLDRYVSRGYLHTDPVATEHFRNYAVQFWERTYRTYPPSSALLRHSAEFGLSRGYACGARCYNGEKAGSLFYFSGDSIEEHSRTEAILQYSVTFLHEALAKIVRASSLKSKNILTLREREILGCMREGKTDREVASSLVISVHTVKFHMKNILYKLNASSRCHALSIALQKNYL
ncbi:MAG: LuxR family transcriptional regulator [Nitrospirae bacterium]|nr:LuxR family transcriptional regulator [Nitrospirota bacterium]